MFAFLKGRISEKKMNHIIMDVNGLGFEVSVPLSTFEKLPAPGSEVKLYVYHHIREDTEDLYGFYTSSEKELFLLILSVSGVGPKIGLAVLSHISPAGFKHAVSGKDIKTLCSIPGLGKKTAERLIVELKDRLGDIQLTGIEKEAVKHEKEMNDALEGLIALGYRESAARQAVGQAMENLTGKPDAAGIIKHALRYL